MEVKHIHQKGKRATQEDSFHIDAQNRFFIICDGVGGQENGKQASSLVTKAATQWIEEQYDQISRDTNWAGLASHISQQLRESAKKQRLDSNMGSTAVIAIRKSNSWHILHAGDSRCYYIPSSGQKIWKTKDHSLVQELFDSGIIKSEKEMASHPKRNVITRAFHLEEHEQQTKLAYHHIPDTQKGDILFLCSDGILEAFPEDGIAQTFLNLGGKLDDALEYIATQCKEKVSDNYTAIGVKV